MGTLDGRPPACAKWGTGNGAGFFDLPPSSRRTPMPGTELRGPTAHARIGPQRGQLRDAAIRFQAVATDVTAERDAWIAAVGGRIVRIGRCVAGARALHRRPRRPVRGAARRLGRGGARDRPPATRPRGRRRRHGPGPRVARLADRRTRRHQAPAVADRHRQTDRPTPPAGRRPAVSGVQRRHLRAATDHPSTTRVARRSSAKLSGCGSSGASRSSTCAVSRA